MSGQSRAWSPPTGPARLLARRTARRIDYYPAYPGQRERDWLPIYMWPLGPGKWWVQR